MIRETRQEEWSQRKEEVREEKGRKVCIYDLHRGNRNQGGKGGKGSKIIKGPSPQGPEFGEITLSGARTSPDPELRSFA